MPEIQEQNTPLQKSQCLCPLQQIPAETWAQLLYKITKPPFRKRHPIIFWTAIIVLILLVILIISSGGSDKKNQDKLTVNEDSLALITIRGAILDPSDTMDWIRQIEECDKIKGVLVRVESPGGGASASQELYESLKRLAQTKIMVVSMGQVAASGGLMVSMAAKRVFANASTLTGSIGVRMDLPKLRGLFDKLGLDQETLVTGKYKAAGSYLAPLSEDEKKYFQDLLADMHAQFVEIVATGRHMDVEKVKQLATGKIYTGKEALTLGLIDELGTQEDAHAWLAKETKISQKTKLVTKPKKQKWLENVLNTCFDLDLQSLVQKLTKQTNALDTPIFSYTM